MDIKRLYGPAAPGNAEATVYTNNQANGDTLVREVTICNPTAGALAYSISVVTRGGAAGAGNRTHGAVAIAANTTIDLQVGWVLGPGDFISVLFTGATMTLMINGEEGDV